jgi:poly(A) polymerase
MFKFYIVEQTFFSKHPEWKTVQTIAKTLLNKGHRAVLAGGCVRDALLGRMAKDLDIATNATPDEMESYFPKVLPLGKSFGVCRVVDGKNSIEVATFREEFDYKDGRRPERVHYSTLEKDALRRDFTINALFYDLDSHQVIDVVHGKEDIQSKILRAVGEPQQRFAEDYLRILRGIRFCGQLQFSLEAQTYQAMCDLRQGLAKISRERVFEEMNKMFSSPAMGDCFSMLEKIGVLPVIFSKWETYVQSGFDLKKLMVRLSPHVSSSQLGWTALYYFFADSDSAPTAFRELFQLKLPKNTIKTAEDIVQAGEVLSQQETPALLAFIRMMNAGCLKEAQIFWDGFYETSDFCEKSKKMADAYLVNGQLPEPLVKGEDVLGKGISGPRVKDILQASYLLQLKKVDLRKTEILENVLKGKASL